AVAQVVWRSCGAGGQGAGEPGHAGADVLAGLLDEPVGVQGQHAAGGQGDVGGGGAGPARPRARGGGGGGETPGAARGGARGGGGVGGHRREPGSYTAYRQVAPASSPSAATTAPSWAMIWPGGCPSRASAAVVVRSWPMIAAAWMLWPVTSPTTSAACPASSGMTSNQSPPARAARPAGR